jgi:hypothetical protein
MFFQVCDFVDLNRFFSWWIPTRFFQPFFFGGFQSARQEAEKCQLSESELRGFVAEAEIDSSGASVTEALGPGHHTLKTIGKWRFTRPGKHTKNYGTSPY